LINGLQIHAGVFEKPTVTTGTIIDQLPPPVDKTPPPEVHAPQIHYIPTPVPADFTPAAPDPDTTITVPTEEFPPTVMHTTPAEPEPVMTGAAVDPRHPLTQPDYPMSAIHLNEQGKIALDVRVGVDGHVLEARVAQSSGSSRLDQAAVNEARAHWRLKPATRNGVPVEQWLTLGVVFRLEDR
jgi:protein TonB